MPLRGKVRYRMKDGVRLAFRGGSVAEAKNMRSGATHTEAEYAADRARKKRRAYRKEG